MEKLTIALDWTPNTNHAGIFFAKQNNLYAEAKLEVTLLSPETDEYAVTPTRKLTTGMVDIAISSSETVFSYRTATNPVLVTAVAALLQNDTSAIATLGNSGITRPMQLDGKIYASYAARFEDYIVKEMVKNDTGEGNISLTYPNKLDIWQKFLQGKADATWIFMGWEGAQAKLSNIGLNTFTMEQYGIPYGYTPIMVTTDAIIEAKKDTLRKFLSVTEAGYKYVVEDINQAAQTLAQTGLPEFANKDFVEASLQMLQPHFLNESSQWGKMTKTKWEAFTAWLIKNKLLEYNVQIEPEKLFINL
jgi:NitT/TauT family transport system substrate-binding protein